jgi:hypothetical protein
MSNSVTAVTTRMLDSTLPTMSELLSVYLFVIDYKDKDHAGLSNMKRFVFPLPSTSGEPTQVLKRANNNRTLQRSILNRHLTSAV